MVIACVTGGWKDHQSPNMGYSGTGAIQSNYLGVSLAPNF